MGSRPKHHRRTGSDVLTPGPHRHDINLFLTLKTKSALVFPSDHCPSSLSAPALMLMCSLCAFKVVDGETVWTRLQTTSIHFLSTLSSRSLHCYQVSFLGPLLVGTVPCRSGTPHKSCSIRDSLTQSSNHRNLFRVKVALVLPFARFSKSIAPVLNTQCLLLISDWLMKPHYKWAQKTHHVKNPDSEVQVLQFLSRFFRSCAHSHRQRAV